MPELLDNDLPVERQDVFDVMQVCRDTPLETLVGADLVDLQQGLESRIHRHNRAETVLYFLDGEADVVVGERTVHVSKGDRLRIGKGVFHGLRTPAGPVRFLSVQTPPILDKSTGVLDLEPLGD